MIYNPSPLSAFRAKEIYSLWLSQHVNLTYSKCRGTSSFTVMCCSFHADHRIAERYRASHI